MLQHKTKSLIWDVASRILKLGKDYRQTKVSILISESSKEHIAEDLKALEGSTEVKMDDLIGELQSLVIEALEEQDIKSLEEGKKLGKKELKAELKAKEEAKNEN